MFVWKEERNIRAEVVTDIFSLLETALHSPIMKIIKISNARTYVL